MQYGPPSRQTRSKAEALRDTTTGPKGPDASLIAYALAATDLSGPSRTEILYLKIESELLSYRGNGIDPWRVERIETLQRLS